MNQYMLKADDALNNDRLNYDHMQRCALAQVYALMAIADELAQLNRALREKSEHEKQDKELQ